MAKSHGFRRTAASAVLLFWAASLGAGQEKAQEPEVTVKLLQPPGRAKPLKLLIEVPLPENTPLKVTLVKASEGFLANGVLLRQEDLVDGRVRPVEGRRVRYEHEGKGPGLYRLFLQNQVTRKKFPPIDIAAWDDDLLREARRRLKDLDQLVADAERVVDRFIQGAATKANWSISGKSLLRELDGLLVKIDGRQDLKTYFTAAMMELYLNIQNIEGTAQALKFGADDKLEGAEDYYGKKPDIKGQPFDFRNIKIYVTTVPSIAGRELALWLIKDFRRQGKRPVLMDEILKDHKDHSGLAPFLKRLEEATEAELEQLEKDLRGEKKSDKPEQPQQPNSPGGNP